jgi:hypothetical protein
LQAFDPPARIVIAMPRLLVSFLVAVSLAGCGSGASSRATDLTLVAVNTFVGRAAFHLTCSPSGGDLRNPARACAAVAARPQLVTSPKPFVCRGGPTSWWDITISGRLRGRRIRTSTSTCWTPQMAMIGRLGIARQLQAHLLPRRREAVRPGSPKTIRSGVLRPGDLVTCKILGHRLEAGVPLGYLTSGAGYGGKDVTPVTLSVTRNGDGSVTASCHVGES